MGSKRKNAEQLTKDLEDVIRKLYTQIQGTNEEKREAITQKVEAKIKSLEDQEKAKQEEKLRKKDEYREKQDEKVNKFKQRAAEIPDDIETLMKEFNYSQKSTVCFFMKKNGIYGKKKILQAIQEKAKLGISEEEANVQIAEEGNVTAQAVARIRNQEKEKQKKIKTKQEEARKQKKQEQKDRVSRFKQRAAEIPDDTGTLMKEFNYKNKNVVYVNMAYYKIYRKRIILQAIQEKANLGISEEEANKQIAKEGHVTVEAVTRIRNQEKEKQEKIKIKQEEARKQKRQMQQEARDQKRQMQEETRKKKEQEQENRVTRFKQRAAEIPYDTATLMEEFNYKSKEVVNARMASYGIYGKIKILQAIQEKAKLGISEEEANEQIAKEGNVTVEAVARIRQGISKPKTRSTRTNVKPSSTQTKTSDKSEVKTDSRTVAVQTRVVEPKTEQPVKTTEDARKPITHIIDTKPGVKTNVAESRQKEKQVQKDEIEEARQREIEKKRLEKELQQVAEENAKKEEAIRQETEVFLKMAKEFWPDSLIKGKFQHIDDYDMILIRRKHKILSREEVEELIETTTLSDEEIAQKANGVVAGVKKVRESIRQRQELIASISDAKRNFIIELIKKSRLY